jgi:PA14 domain/Domain of unknown function (DUF5122) beta-propeller
VSPNPIRESPRIMDGTVLALAEAGNKIIVGGTFTTVRDYNSSVSVTRNWIFAFDKTTGLIDGSFAPLLDRDVNALAVSPDGQWVYVGGAFTTVNGVARNKLVKLSVTNGQADPAFGAKPDQAVEDLALTGNMLILGGRFTRIGNVARPQLAAVDPTTGAVLDGLNIPVTVARDNPTASPNVVELDTSPDGRWLVIVGNFTFVGGLLREQVALINLSTGPASVASWATTRFQPDCSTAFPGTYINDVAFSPDNSFFVITTTGGFGANRLCDSAQRWEVAGGPNAEPTWVSYTGGDTHWHAQITKAAVYVGGHQRWENNPTPSPGRDDDGPGAVSRTGIAALDPLTGVPLSWNPGRQRGKGVEAFLATTQYLYVGSDTKTFGGTTRQRLAILPTAGGTVNPLPDTLSLPVTVYSARQDGTLWRSTYDGVTMTAGTRISGPTVDGNNWSSLRDAWVQRGQMYYFGAGGAYYRRSFDGTTFGPVTNLSTSVGYVDANANLTPYDQPYNVDTTRALAYKAGRLYYTRTNDTRLFWRWFSLESGIIGAQEYLASAANWSGATSLEIAGNWLYASWNDNRLYRSYVDGPRVDAARTPVQETSGIPWTQLRALAFIQAAGPGTEPAPPAPLAPVICPAGQWKAEYFQGTQLTGASTIVRCEPAINNTWGTGAPPGTGLSANQFSVRWTGTRRMDVAGAYQMSVRADDGAMLFVDGTPVISSWVDRSTAATSTATVNLTAGNHEFRLEYFKNVGSGVAQLSGQIGR